jgi:hypothetical protein
MRHRRLPGNSGRLSSGSLTPMRTARVRADRTAADDACGETARRTIDNLRREEPELEVHDRLNLCGRWRSALRVTGNRIGYLADETIADHLTRLRCAAVPHHGAQEFQIRRRPRPPVHHARAMAHL